MTIISNQMSNGIVLYRSVKGTFKVLIDLENGEVTYNTHKGCRLIGGKTGDRPYYHHEDGVSFTTQEEIPGAVVCGTSNDLGVYYYWYDFEDEILYSFDNSSYYHSSSDHITIQKRGHRWYINRQKQQFSSVYGVSQRRMYYLKKTSVMMLEWGGGRFKDVKLGNLIPAEYRVSNGKLIVKSSSFIGEYEGNSFHVIPS